MYASPVADADDVTLRSLKTRVSLTREEAALARRRCASTRPGIRERARRPLPTGSSASRRSAPRSPPAPAILAARNDEEGAGEADRRPSSHAMRTYGYLAPIEDDDMYVLTPLVPMVLDRGLADQWLGSETTDENASADGRTNAGPDGRPMEDIEQDAFDFNTDDNRFDEEEH